MREKKWIVTARQRCDLELLLVGGFNPLSGFLSREDYDSVLSSNRLSTGQLWPMPITLDVHDEFAKQVIPGEEIMLCDSDNSLIATMLITDKWRPNKALEAWAIYGTEDQTHPGVDYTLNQSYSWYLGGPVTLLYPPKHYDFNELRYTPQQLKEHFQALNVQKIVAFQTRNPLHRAHMELTLRAAQQHDAHLLIHPVVGLTKIGDIDYFTRVRCYQKIIPYYPKGTATLSLLPLAMRMAGPKEALWHALIRKNYGCTHFIVGRDHAGPGKNAQGQNFYDDYAAQELAIHYQDELGIQVVPFAEMVYVKERNHYCPINEVQNHETALTISGTELRDALVTQSPIPEWFSFPDVVDELRQSYPPKHEQGMTLFFTGLPSSGKTTLAQALMARLHSYGKKTVSLLDGDVVRRHLAGELGFSKEDRDLNIHRIGFVAAEITKMRGIALCAAIAPYEEARVKNRQLISQYGHYIEIYVATSLAVCENRDVKKLYEKVRKGEISGLTGVDDPYERPKDAEIVLNTEHHSVAESVDIIIDFLQKQGYLQRQSV